MTLPLEPPVAPMLSRLRPDIPLGDGWLYEPKWDGFRAIVFRDGDRIQIESRNGLALHRYFPELCETLAEGLPDRCVVDGEVVVIGPDGLEFEVLQMRIHPAESRIKKLAQETPASFVAFDLLALGDDDLTGQPLTARRQALASMIEDGPHLFLTPQTSDPESARDWFERFEGAGLDGVVAKRVEQTYEPGERVMVKVKHERTVDCVVGGYRLSKSGDGVGSLLLGLNDGQGVLHHVGHTSSFKAAERRDLLAELKPLEGGTSFGHGRTPGGPSRWAQGRDASYVPLDPVLVCEVSFEKLQGDRFRHAARFLRWRPDKSPTECTYDQLEPPRPFSLDEIRRLSR